MTKFVTMVIGVAFFAVVFSAAALADGWKVGNWEPPTKAPMVKAVSLNADWGAVAPIPSVAPAGCSGMAHVEPARQRVGCNGSRYLGWRIFANRQARARARMGGMAIGHS